MTYKCVFINGMKCAANELLPCDFEGDDFNDCLRFKVKNLNTEFTQLR